MHTARVAPKEADFRPALPLCLLSGFTEKQMGMTYIEQLRHPNWQKRRLEMLSAAEWKCQRCYDGDTTLNVHHKRYVKGRMAWEYGDYELEVVCEPCHKAGHEDRDMLAEVITRLPHEFLTEAACVLAGWCIGNYMEDIYQELDDFHALAVGDLACRAGFLPINAVAAFANLIEIFRVRQEQFQSGDFIDLVVSRNGVVLFDSSTLGRPDHADPNDPR